MNILPLAFLFSLLFLAGFLAGCAFQVFYKKPRLQKQNEQFRRDLDELSGKIQDIQYTQSKFVLNPHLFKNTLNSIQSYAFRTHQSLEKLGHVLDYILYDSNAQLVSVREELEFATHFIDLNRIKLTPLFDIRTSIHINEQNPLYTQPLLAPLITAYFIENAFKHADLQSSDAFISIECRLSDDHFYFSVANKISQAPIFKGKGGIGTTNMRLRLDTLYGNCYTLDYRNENGIYTSVLTINLLEFKSKMPDIG